MLTNMKYKNLFMKKILIKTLIIITLFVVVFLLFYSKYYNEKQNSIVLKTQYTYSVRIDQDGNVIKDEDNVETTQLADSANKDGNSQSFSDLGLETIAKIWITQFTNQFQQNYLSNLKSIKDVVISKIEVLNSEENIVLIVFACEPRSNIADYFTSWNGYKTEGRLECEWVVQFEIEDLYDNTARIFAKSIQLPEDYGLATSKSTSPELNTKAVAAANQAKINDKLYTYEIKNNKLTVTYDGGEKWSTVPVDTNNLHYMDTEKTKLLEGSFQVGLEKSAFLYGGNVVAGKSVPLTVIYSDNKGNSWTSATLTDIVGITFYYINFTDAKNGVAVIAYNQNNHEENSMILITQDGGETWRKNNNGKIFNIVRSALFVDNNVGFINYEYQNGMESNLYMTTDGGESFTPVILNAQQFEDPSTKLSWNSVYKDIQLPYLNDQGYLILLVTQGKNGDYNGGDSVAKYESTDNGRSWKYMGEE